MREPTYSIGREYNKHHPNGRWTITYLPAGYGPCEGMEVVFETPVLEGDFDDSGEPPLRVRIEYERLMKYDPAEWKNRASINAVELITAGRDCAFDQPCKWGRRVEWYAVYCHNPKWLYAPSKCRRRAADSWIGQAWPHELCAGFEKNPNANPPQTANPQAG